MSDASAAASPVRRFFVLPGAFPPDTLEFAFRTAAALLLAYFVGFWVQLDSASSAGVTVAIVAQASPGMALSKAFWRVVGTCAGGAAALAIIAAFPQDRTMLLLAFIAWLALCTFTASLLRDFRAYGAVLAGYTVGIVVISDIDAPQAALLTTLNRIAAILIGVGAVAVVNTVFARATAYDALVVSLRRQLAETTAFAADVLAGRQRPDAVGFLDRLSAVLALRTDATYAAAERPDGAARSAGAKTAVASLAVMLGAARGIGQALKDGAPGPAVSAALAEIATTMEFPPDPPRPADGREVYLLERARELARRRRMACDGLRALETGVRLRDGVALVPHRDYVGAGLTALRTIVAVGLGSLFCVYGGWTGATGLLVQQSAFTALLGMQANPTAAALGAALALPISSLVAFTAGFEWLPLASGFVPFAIAVGSGMFFLAVLAHHPRLTRAGSSLLLYFPLMLAPSNPPSFDIASFLNTFVLQALAVLFMALAFRLVLPVSPHRRLSRLAFAICTDLRKTMLRGRAIDERALSRQYDRLGQIAGWLDHPPSIARRALAERLTSLAALDFALRRAAQGIAGAAAGRGGDAHRAAVLDGAAASLIRPTAAGLAESAAHLARLPKPDTMLEEALSGLEGAALLLRQEHRALLRYGVVAG